VRLIGQSMTTNTLNTFGAILTFAVDLEDAMQHFYDQAKDVADGDLAQTFEDYARKSGKRKQRLISVRQDNVTEMILEPISGLNAADYEPLYGVPSSVPDALEKAIELETRTERFYKDAGPKLNVTEPRRAFQKLAQENAERVTELRELRESA